MRMMGVRLAFDAVAETYVCHAVCLPDPCDPPETGVSSGTGGPPSRRNRLSARASAVAEAETATSDGEEEEVAGRQAALHREELTDGISSRRGRRWHTTPSRPSSGSGSASLREELDGVPPEERRRVAVEFEGRFGGCSAAPRRATTAARSPICSASARRVRSLRRDRLAAPRADFDEAVTPSQLNAAAELYFVYQHERMRVFQVAEVLKRLFREGRMRVQRGPGARGLYTAREAAAAALRREGPARRLQAGVQLRPRGAPVRRHRQRQLPLPARRADVRARAVFPRPDDRRGDPRRPGARAAAVRHAGHRAAPRDRPALRARPRELRQHRGAHPRDRALSQAAARPVRRARHQALVRRHQPLAGDRAGLRPLSRRRARAVAAGQDGRERPPGAALRHRRRFRDRRRPAALQHRGAAGRRPRRGLDRRLPPDRGRPALPRHHARTSAGRWGCRRPRSS